MSGAPEGWHEDLGGAELDAAARADQLFVDALLQRELCGKGARAEVERGVRRALASIDRERRPRLRLVQRIASLAAALALCAVALVMLGGPGAERAEAQLQRSLAAARASVDRRYAVAAEHGPRGLAADLYVRGGERFTVALRSGLFAGAWLGYDGREAWVVPAIAVAPVWVGGEPQALQSWIAERDVELPFLRIDKLLHQLGAEYELTLLSSGDDGGPVRLRGTRRAADTLRPASIEFTARADDGVVTRLVATFDGAGAASPRRVSFELEAEEPLADGWYGHAAHHDAGRPTRRM